MTKKKTRIKSQAVEHWVPSSRDDVNQAIYEIGTCQRERNRIMADMNDEIARVKARYEEDAKPFKERIEQLSKGVQLWCETHRGELTKDGKVKTHRFAAGLVRWRIDPPSVAVRGVEVVLEKLRALGLTQFIRTKDEVNKEAILADPEKAAHITGISIRQKEKFIVQPDETELEEVA